jgi:hypothetical protein
MLGMWGVQPSEWILAAQPTCPSASAEPSNSTAAVVNGVPITHGEIEQRARLLALSAKIGDQAKAEFKRLIFADSTHAAIEKLKEDVVRSNPGRSQEELIAIFKEGQQQLGQALHKQAVETALCDLLPKLREEAREQLIQEWLK